MISGSFAYSVHLDEPQFELFVSIGTVVRGLAFGIGSDMRSNMSDLAQWIGIIYEELG